MLFSLYFQQFLPQETLPYFGVVALCCVVAFCCARAVARGYRRAVQILVGLVVLGMMAANWLARYPDWDETEHLHSSWLVSQGLLPYRAFFEHHSPALWLLLAPLVKLLPHTGVILDVGRICACLFSLAAWGLAVLLARRVHGPVRGLSYVMALLGASAIGFGEFQVLRPDLVADVMAMGALWVLLASRLRWRMLISGVLLGVAFAFTPKLYFFLALLPVLYLGDIACSVRPRLAPLSSRAFWSMMATRSLAEWLAPVQRAWRGNSSARSISVLLTSPAPLPALFTHFVGVALGMAPLYFWLYAHGLVPHYLFWTLEFNQLSPAPIGGAFPLQFALIGIIWLAHSRVQHWSTVTRETKVLAISLLFGALVLFTYKTKFVYNTQMFLLLTSVVGARVVCDLFAFLAARKYAWVCGGLIGLSLLSFYPLMQWWPLHEYLDGRQEVAMLNSLCPAGASVVCVPPRHPLFALDATDLSLPWQWDHFIFDFDAVRDRLRHIDQQIMDKRPTVIFCGEALVRGEVPYPLPPTGRFYFVQQLWIARVLSIAQAEQLQGYIERHYQLVKFVRHYYWVRNDLVTADMRANVAAHAADAYPEWSPKWAQGDTAQPTASNPGDDGGNISTPAPARPSAQTTPTGGDTDTASPSPSSQLQQREDTSGQHPVSPAAQTSSSGMTPDARRKSPTDETTH